MAKSASVDKLILDLEALQAKTGLPRDIALWRAGVYARDVMSKWSYLPFDELGLHRREAFQEWDLEEYMQDVYTGLLRRWDRGHFNPEAYEPGTWGALCAKTVILHKLQAAKRKAERDDVLPWDVTEQDVRELAENNGWRFAEGNTRTGVPSDPYDPDPEDER